MSIWVILGGIVAFFSFEAAIIGFFVMQSKQNTDIALLKSQRVEDLKIIDIRFDKNESRLSKNLHYQMETEKAIIKIESLLGTELKHISTDIEELKKRSLKNDSTD